MSKSPEHSQEIVDSMLNPTFHDVQIKQVEIVNPNTASVKFQEIGIPHQNVSISASENKVTNEEFITYRTKAAKSPNLKTLQENPAGRDLASRLNSQPVPMVTVPLDPNQNFESRRGQIPTPGGIEERKLQHQKLHEKKQQIIESFARQTSHRRHSGARRIDRNPRYFEVSPGVFITEHPQNRLQAVGSAQSRTNGEKRVSTAMQKSRWNHSASSRAVSSSSSKWRTEQLMQPKPNHFIKMPFKQVPALTMDANYKLNDDMIYPGEEMRAMTALTVSRIQNAFKQMPEPSRLDSRQGRLLKAKLKPLRPVSLRSPHVHTCQGIQPEYRRKQGYSPSPSRQRHLKQQYLEICKMNEGNTLEAEYEKRINSTSPVQSIHPTSPVPESSIELSNEIFPQLQPDYLTSKNVPSHNAAYDDYARQQRVTLDQQFKTMHLEPSVIF